MPEEQKETYPVIPAKHWWTLRERFNERIPREITPGFLATSLGMQETSAKSNIIPSLVMMGIIDQEGKPTERAVRWRDDTTYPAVCDEIRQALYPQELRDAMPGPTIDRTAVERWFATKTRVGRVGAKRFAVVYELLSTAAIPGKREKPSTLAKPKPLTQRRPAKSVPEEPVAQAGGKSVVLSSVEPSIHIDIQIHISPDANADQIDQIFASMARHLRNLREGYE